MPPARSEPPKGWSEEEGESAILLEKMVKCSIERSAHLYVRFGKWRRASAVSDYLKREYLKSTRSFLDEHNHLQAQDEGFPEDSSAQLARLSGLLGKTLYLMSERLWYQEELITLAELSSDTAEVSDLRKRLEDEYKIPRTATEVRFQLKMMAVPDCEAHWIWKKYHRQSTRTSEQSQADTTPASGSNSERDPSHTSAEQEELLEAEQMRTGRRIDAPEQNQANNRPASGSDSRFASYRTIAQEQWETERMRRLRQLDAPEQIQADTTPARARPNPDHEFARLEALWEADRMEIWHYVQYYQIHEYPDWERLWRIERENLARRRAARGQVSSTPK